jgi:hypothetical protein
MNISVQEFSISAGTEENPAVGALELWKKLNSDFELPESAYGGTGYLDGLKAEDMPEPVVAGTDRHERPFIAIRFEVTNKRGKTRKGVEVYFQRYTNDCPDIWVSGGSVGIMISNMRVSDYNFLVELVANGEATLSEKMYYGSDEMRIRKFKLI